MTKAELKASVRSVIKNSPPAQIRGNQLADKLEEIIDECYPVGGSAFPLEIVEIFESSIPWSADMKGKILVIGGSTITMPTGNIFEGGELIGVIMLDSDTSSVEIMTGVSFKSYSGGMGPAQSEFVLLQAVINGGTQVLLPISTSLIEDNGILKTALKYQMDRDLIFTIGSVSFEDINEAATDTYLEFAAAELPVDYYIDAIFVNQTEAFDGDVETIYVNYPELFNVEKANLVEKQKYTGSNDIIGVGSNDGRLIAIQMTNPNPKNLTSGNIKVSALLKKFL